MSKKLKIGLIGCGTWGRNILNDLVSLGALTTVIDIDYSLESRVLELGAVSFQTDISGIERFDGIIISTPASTHLKILESLGDIQTPVFVEKPLCTSSADLDDIKKHNVAKNIFLMHVWRYHGGIIELGRIAGNGLIGKPVQLVTKRTNWTSPRQDVDSVWTLVPHDLTIALEILGYIPEPVSAVCEIYDNKARGMQGVMGDGPVFMFEVSNRYFEKRREVRLHCEGGVAVLKDEITDSIDIYHGDSLSNKENVSIDKITFNNPPPLKSEIETFMNYLEGGDKPKSDISEGVMVVEKILELRKLANLT